MKVKDLLAVLAVAGGALALAMLSGCSIGVKEIRLDVLGHGPQAPGLTQEQAQAQVLADERVLIAWGCDWQAFETVLLAQNVKKAEAITRSITAYAAAVADVRCETFGGGKGPAKP